MNLTFYSINPKPMFMQFMRCCKTLTMVAIVSVALESSTFAVEETSDGVKQFIENWAASFDGNDPEKIMTFYDHSEELEVVVSAGVSHHGYKAMQKAYVDDMKRIRFHDSKATEVSVRILSETAIVTFEHQFKMESRADASRWQTHIRTTSVLHRIGGKWKIVLEHSSSIRDKERTTRIAEPKDDENPEQPDLQEGQEGDEASDDEVVVQSAEISCKRELPKTHSCL